MKILFFIYIFLHLLHADTKKIYFYTTDININNFKSLKINFDTYLSKYGHYEFQPFNNKETFETQLKNRNSVVILSSWHYLEIAKKYNLEATLVAQKKASIVDTKILVGKKDIKLQGLVTSAYNKEYTNELLTSLTKEDINNLSILIVPKEIDALMSVGFGMSKFALVSKESFTLLEEINPFLAKSLKIYSESDPKYRMVLAPYDIDIQKANLSLSSKRWD